MSSSRLRSALVAAGVAAVVAVGLSGCFNPVDMVNRGVEEAVEGAVEGATGGDVSLGGELPEGFPAEVPLIDGTITFAAGTGGADGWFVTIESGAADPVAEAVSVLEAAGFGENPDLQGVDLGVAAIRTNGTYDVFVAGDEKTVTYTVTESTSSQ